MTFYRLSVDIIAPNYLVFEKIAFFLHFGNRQTNEQMDSTDVLSSSRCRERQLNKCIMLLVMMMANPHQALEA